MATHNHAGFDNREQLVVSDLIEYWESVYSGTEPQLTFFQKCRQKISDFSQHCDDFLASLPTWVKVAILVTAIRVVVGDIFTSCHRFWRFNNHYDGFQPTFCRPIIGVIDLCTSLPYCKPLLSHAFNWLA